MFDFINPNPDQPEWRWTVHATASQSGTLSQPQHVRGTWPSPTAESVANWLGWQMVERDYSRWVITVWVADDPTATPVYTYTETDHFTWIAKTPESDPVMQAIISAVRQLDNPSEPIVIGVVDLPPALVAQLAELTAPQMDGGEFGQSTSAITTLMRLIVDVATEGGPDAVTHALAELSKLYDRAVPALQAHAQVAHGGQPWTDCEVAARLMRDLSNAYVALYAALGR